MAANFRYPLAVPGDAVSSVRSIVEDLDVEVEFDAPIGVEMTWYRVGGRADVLARPRSVEALCTLMRRCHETGTIARVLGSGANLLVADEGVDGIVVHLDHAAFREVSTIHRHRIHRAGVEGRAGDAVRVMAGKSLEQLVISTATQGLSGIECMAGVPASVGGAIRMNAGGKFGCIGDAVAAVGCINVKGDLVVHEAPDIAFEYRRCSIIDPVILWAELALTPDDPARTHAKVKEIFAYKKQSQPMAANSAGCVFRNPPAGDGSGRLVSAGELIDRAGLKGTSIGGATISERHANFFTAEPGACADDIIALIDHAARVVEEESGYELVRELVVWKRQETRRSGEHV